MAAHTQDTRDRRHGVSPAIHSPTMALVLPLIGVVLGLAIGGWLGAVVGFLLALVVLGLASADAPQSPDTGARRPPVAAGEHSIEERRFRFCLMALQVAGHIFRSEGPQEPERTNWVEGYMDGAQLSEPQRAEAARAHEEGASSQFVLRDALAEVSRVSKGDRAWLRLVVEIQWSAALCAGGGTVGVQRRILDRIGNEFGLVPAERSEIERKSMTDYQGALAAHGVSHSESERHGVSATAARRGRHFQLTLGGKTIRDPSPGAIREAVSAVEKRKEEFVILDRGGDGLTYVQCYSGHGGLQLEYQDGNLQHHYKFADGWPPKETVLRVFLGFFHGDGQWVQELPWRRMQR